MVNNIITVGIFNVSGIIPLLKGYTEFSNNTASIVFSFGKYVQLDEEAELLISDNKIRKHLKDLYLKRQILFQKRVHCNSTSPLVL